MVILKGALLLNALILMHEWGHFIAARWTGIEVKELSIGLGPRLFLKQGIYCDYSVRAFPFGGFVKFKDEQYIGKIKSWDGSFSSAPVLRRFAVIISGPAINILLALFIMPVAYMVGINVPAYQEKPIIVGYTVPGSAADELGLEPGSEIKTLDSFYIPTWNQANSYLANMDPAAEVVAINFFKNEKKQSAIIPKRTSLEALGIIPAEKVQIGAVRKGGAADEAGLLPGDIIKSIAGHTLFSYAHYRHILSEKCQPECTAIIESKSEQRSVTIKPEVIGDSAKLGFAGVHPTLLKQFSPLESLHLGLDKIGKMLSMSADLVQRLVSGKAQADEIGGPISAIKSAGNISSSSSGAGIVAALIAFFSLQIGLFNLLPLPGLDGGALVFLGCEAIRGKPLPAIYSRIFQIVGVSVVGGLLVFAVLVDLFAR